MIDEMPLTEGLRRNIISQREACSINKSMLAALISTKTGKACTRSNITRWESGATVPNINFIASMAAIFNVSIDELVYG